MQFNVVFAREIYKKLYELEHEKNSCIDVNREAILFAKALHMQLYGEKIIFCADQDFFVSKSPTGYAVAGYFIQENNVKVPFTVTVNKLDNNQVEKTYEFYSLGIGDPFVCSAENNKGIGDILDECLKHFFI